MPLAAVIIPGLAPDATAARSGGSAAPDRMGAGGAFDALLTGGAADDRLRQQLMTGSAARADWRVDALPSQRIVPGGEALAAGDSPDVLDPAMPGAPVTGAPDLPRDLSAGEGKPAAPGKGGPGPDLVASPVEPGEEALGGPVKGAPVLRPDSSPVEPGKEALESPVKGAPGPDLVSSPVEPGEEQLASPVKGAPVLRPDSSPVEPGEPAPGGAASPAPQPAAPEREAGAADQSEAGPDAEAELKASAQTPAPGPAPDRAVPANAASVRREADGRGSVRGSEAGKAGDAAVKPGQGGAKAEAPPPAPAAAPAKAGAPDMPPAARSAVAFQALLQAQARPGGEAPPPRAADLALDPSGDTGLRSAPDRAAEVLRTPSLTQAGAPPRFAPQTVQTLAAQIVRRQGEGGRVFDIRLDPPELGRVGVRLEMGKDQMVKAMLSAERPDTLQELQRTARDLERALADAGFDLAENGLSFTLGGEGGERDGSASDAPRGARSVVDVAVARPGAPAAALYGFALARAAGLDIQA
ncbi:MAG: flagellar hook-length control protein FliK [Oceanicaulis sp.]|nr:flagellar hook-length control protein FliK [Oceanicaulis sp.]